MTPETLASNANIALYAAMVVFTLAMLAFAGHLAARAPRRTDEYAAERAAELAPELAVEPAVRRSAERESVLVGGGGGTEVSAPVPAPPPASESATSRQRGSIGLTLTYLGTLLLVASVLMRGLAVSRPPWGNMFEFATAAVAAVAVTFSLLARRNRWEWLGVFIVGPILLVLGLSLTVLYTEAGQLMPALRSYWLGIHVSVAFIAVALFTIACAIGVLYLVRLRREQSPPAKPNFIESLPSSAKLEQTAYGLNMVGFILWTFTVIAGAIWAKEAWGAYWQWDPKEVWSFVIWTVYAAYMHGRATAGMDLRKSTYIALAGYVAVILNFTLVNLASTFAGMHNYSGM